MIQVTHPDPEKNRSQQEFLSKCPSDQQRQHELIFSYGNASYRYHTQAREFEPTRTDWEQWLEGLPEKMRQVCREQGFEASKTVLSFTRYVMEKNDVGLEAFVRQLMGEHSYADYLSMFEK